MFEQLVEEFQENELEDFINRHRQPTFQEVLFSFIENKGLQDPEVYKRAGIDRKLFSKIRSNRKYHPRKNTIVALALALELSYEQTDHLLDTAGYTLSDSDTSDLIIKYCLEKKMYDIDNVNQTLEYFSLKTLT
ncbi:hypothetical protein [Peribacillus acanthi]|uniref:hypothetical protein n=1 Tax=Peribacillus acanthi TaxID=2171554 RepID=UPI000D3EAC7A|nr:hypothetical protein [Peribacillus acanthi]